jgi:RimJ/RimL family protein N-acetyltransferase
MPNEIVPLSVRDCEAAAEILNDDLAVENLMWGAGKVSLEQMVASIQDAGRRGDRFFAITGDGDEIIGVVTVSRIDLARRHAQVGIALRKDVRGMGLSQAVSAQGLVRVAFGELNLNRLYGQAIETNKAAIALCRNLGVREEGYVPKDVLADGTFVGNVYLGLVRDDYKGHS